MKFLPDNWMIVLIVFAMAGCSVSSHWSEAFKIAAIQKGQISTTKLLIEEIKNDE